MVLVAPYGLRVCSSTLYSLASAHDTSPADIGEMPVPLSEFAEFASQGVTRLRALKAQGFDLSIPIFYLVASYQSHVVDERFSYALLSFERLVNHHARSRGLSNIVESKGFEMLRRALGAQIEAQVAATPPLIVPKAAVAWSTPAA
jgi:hypothetical protein